MKDISQLKMTIQATEILKLFSSIKKLGADYNITQHESGFLIEIYYCWYDGDYRWTSLFIANDNVSKWTAPAEYDFQAMMSTLGGELEKQKQKELKAQKRKELISRLTQEERELLNLR
jgi:hypothetical protein